MAVLQRVNFMTTDRQARLAELLEAEWANPHPQNTEPLIIEERPRQEAAPNHIYVVWGEWGDLSPLERSRVIFTAYARKLGPGNEVLADEVTLAMGLTPEEAKIMNIEL